MNKSSDSKKLALIYLQQLFLERTDENHYVSMKDIISYLEEKDVFLERRTVYTCIRQLEYAGMEIEGVQLKDTYGYHLRKRLFDTSELKFLIDSVSGSKFLTERKSKELTDKIKTLGSVHQYYDLDRKVMPTKRIKSMNDKVFSNLDFIYKAIQSNSQITFQYMKWTTKKTLENMKSGRLFCVSPFAISLNDDNYYLIAYDETECILKHYRIDKMTSIKLTMEERNGKDRFKSFDIIDYSKKTFGMFAGEEKTISIEASNNLVGVFVDRFGKEIHIRPSLTNPNTFVARFTVNVSPQFYGWLFGLGKGVKITSPESAKEEFQKTITDILSNYDS